MSEIKLVLENLNCPNCAAKIEDGINRLDKVEKASFNMVSKEMSIAYSDIDENSLIKKVKKIVNKYESGVTVHKKSEHHHSHSHQHSHSHSHSHQHSHTHSGSEKDIIKKAVIRLLSGSILFALALSNIFGSFSFAFYIAAYIIFGYDVLLKAATNIFHGNIFDENFLMSIATIGAFFIGEYPEAAAVMLFYQIGEFFQDMAVDRSTRSIKDLMGLMPEFVNLVDNDGNIKRISPKEASLGDTIVIKNGEKIPLDCKITEGETSLDTSALTGESAKVFVKKGDSILSGCINDGSVIYATVEKTYENTTVKKIMDLVENATANKSKTEGFITTFARIYTPIVCFAALLLFLLPTVMGFDYKVWLYRALVFLVSSCPCALVVSIPLTFFSGLGTASKKGILIKGSNYLQALASLDTAVFDKTGTLTKGVFKVTEIDGNNTLGICSALERFSNHPIAAAVLDEYKGETQEAVNVEEIKGCGLKGEIEGKIALAGNDRLMEQFNIKYQPSDKAGTIIYVAYDDKYEGSIVVSDIIKEDSYKGIELLNNNKIQTIMLTGDKKEIADKTAKELSVTKVYSQLLPQDKVKKVEELYDESPDRCLAFVGDGINDAPVLARANIGVAMGGIGSDAAIEAADVVIMNDEISKLWTAVKIARGTMRLAKQNLVFVLVIKLAVLLLAAVGYANMWLAVFADVGVALLAILNALRKK